MEVEHWSSTPLIFSTSGGMGKFAQTFYERLASPIAEKRQPTYQMTMYLFTLVSVHTYVSFSLQVNLAHLQYGLNRNLPSSNLRYVCRPTYLWDSQAVICSFHLLYTSKLAVCSTNICAYTYVCMHMCTSVCIVVCTCIHM